MSRSAGSAITASPSQLGASTTTWEVPGDTSRLQLSASRSCLAEGNIPGARSRGDVAPATRHRRCIQSQSSGWRRTYISSTSVHRCVNSRTASGRVGARRLDRGLVDHTIPAAGQRQREQRDDGGPGAQGQCRQRRGGRRRPPEEIDVHRIGAGHVLVDQDPDPVPGRQQAHDPPHGPLTVDHRVAGAGPHLFQHLVKLRVVQRPRQHGHRLELEGVRDRLLLPEPEVPGAEQDARARARRPAAPGPPPPTPPAPASGRRGASCTSATRTAGSRSARTSSAPAAGAPAAIEAGTPPPGSPARSAGAPGRGRGTPARAAKPHARTRDGDMRRTADATDCTAKVLEPVPHAVPPARARPSRSASQGRQAGSMATRSGTQASGGPTHRCAARRTMSFSVVSTRSAPDRSAASPMSTDSRAEYAVMVPEAARPGQLPAGSSPGPRKNRSGLAMPATAYARDGPV